MLVYVCVWTALGSVETPVVGFSDYGDDSIADLCMSLYGLPNFHAAMYDINSCGALRWAQMLVLRRRQVAERGMKAALVPPLDPASGGQLNGVC